MRCRFIHFVCLLLLIPTLTSAALSPGIPDGVEFVRVMGFEKPILMGQPMGAATVKRIGAEHPDLARAVVMLDPGLPRPGAAGRAAGGPPPVPDRLSISMVAAPETLVAQNNYSFDDLVATCRRSTPRWDLVDCQYWALSKKQYHGPYTTEAWQAMSGSMATGDSLGRIPMPALILEADGSPEVRKANEDAAGVLKQGRVVHIDGAGHNLHHDELQRTLDVLTPFLSAI